MYEPNSDRPLSGIAGVTAQLAGWATIAIGVLHLIVGVATSTRWSLGLLWFEGSGIAVILIGTLTLLVRRRAGDRTLRRVALGANTVGVALGVAFCLLTEWQEPQGILLIIVFAAAALACVGIRSRGPT